MSISSISKSPPDDTPHYGESHAGAGLGWLATARCNPVNGRVRVSGIPRGCVGRKKHRPMETKLSRATDKRGTPGAFPFCMGESLGWKHGCTGGPVYDFRFCASGLHAGEWSDDWGLRAVTCP